LQHRDELHRKVINLESQLREKQAEGAGAEALTAELRRKLARATEETERLSAEADAGREVASEKTLAGRVEANEGRQAIRDAKLELQRAQQVCAEEKDAVR
jgi:hypothetical protein